MKRYISVASFILLSTALSASAEIIYSDNDYGCGWENYASQTTIDNSYEIGVNVAILAAKGTGKVKIMQVVHNGDWYPDGGGLGNLVDKINAVKTPGFATHGGDATLGVTDLSDVNMLYLTGHGVFSLSDEEKTALKAYLCSGGVLFVDDCGNVADSDGFDSSFRALITEIYGANLAVLPSNHAVYSSHYMLDGNDFSYTDAGNGTEWNTEPLEGFTPPMCPDENTVDVDATGIILTRNGETGNDQAQFKMKGVVGIPAGACPAGFTVTIDGMSFPAGNETINCYCNRLEECVINIKKADFTAIDFPNFIPEGKVCLNIPEISYCNTGTWTQYDSGSGSWTKYRKDNW